MVPVFVRVTCMSQDGPYARWINLAYVKDLFWHEPWGCTKIEFGDGHWEKATEKPHEILGVRFDARVVMPGVPASAPRKASRRPRAAA